MLRPMIDAQRVAIAEIEAWWPDINREPIYSPNATGERTLPAGEKL
jgi:hypothetical protein